MSRNLTGKRIAILATDGYEQAELDEPHKALSDAGAEVVIVSLRPGRIQGMRHHDRGDSIDVDEVIDASDPDRFAGLVLPGGVINPDELRTNQACVSFVGTFVRSGKPVGAICHGPWTLIEADVVAGRQVTSWPSLQTDLRNAGANWVDREVVIDGNLVTSRKPDDLPAFCRALIDLLDPDRKTSGDGTAALEIEAQPRILETLVGQEQIGHPGGRAEPARMAEFEFSQQHSVSPEKDAG